MILRQSGPLIPEATATAIDEEVKRLLMTLMKRRSNFEENIDKLTLVAETLLDIETLMQTSSSLFIPAKRHGRDRVRSPQQSRRESGKIARQKEEAAKEYAAEKAAAEQEQENTLHLRFENMKAENIVFENKKNMTRRRKKSLLMTQLKEKSRIELEGERVR